MSRVIKPPFPTEDEDRAYQVGFDKGYSTCKKQLRVKKGELREVLIEHCPNFGSSFCADGDCKTCEDVTYQRDAVIAFLNGKRTI